MPYISGSTVSGHSGFNGMLSDNAEPRQLCHYHGLHITLSGFLELLNMGKAYLRFFFRDLFETLLKSVWTWILAFDLSVQNKRCLAFYLVYPNNLNSCSPHFLLDLDFL